MFRCKFINFLFTVLPIKSWQGFLIRRHIQKCPACLSRLADVEEVKPLLIQESEFEDLESVWPAVKARIDEGRKEGQVPLWRWWKWVTAAAVLFVAVAVWLWFFSPFSPGNGPSEEPLAGQFQIDYIEIENEPAQAYIYRPQDSNTYFVWVEKKS
ncbi:MAG: hypothetical protein PVI11_06355 [Candidatus Aminicenantes bacterium]|jgi:hypothetical protein